MRTTQTGFTVVELMITILIAALLLGLGVPAMQQMIINNRLVTQTNRLVTQISLARSEAVKRGQPVVLCRSDDPLASPPACGGDANDWSTGWLLFYDDNDNNDYDDGVDTLIQVNEGVTGAISVMTNGTADAFFTYQGDGTSFSTNNAVFAVCNDDDGSTGRQITISAIGRPNLVHGTADAAIDCTPD